jgi:hypothetical protein
MSKIRVKIPTPLQIAVLYKSAKSCAVCHEKTGLHIHHIDQNPSNNVESNLIVLCTPCHDEAHSHHDLTQNLDEKKLIEFKQKWEEEVETISKKAMTDDHGKSLINWAYFNFNQLPKYITTHVSSFKDHYYYYLVDNKIINENLEIIVSDESTKKVLYKSVFNALDIRDAHYLNQYYENMVNELIRKINPYEMNAIWNITSVKALLNPGDFIFLINGMFFKRVSVENKVETRRVLIKVQKIVIQGFLYTNYMFGSSSYCDSFIGHKTAAGFFYIKSINRELGNMVIHVTPLALGSGNYSYISATPFELREKNG